MVTPMLFVQVFRRSRPGAWLSAWRLSALSEGLQSWRTTHLRSHSLRIIGPLLPKRHPRPGYCLYTSRNRLVGAMWYRMFGRKRRTDPGVSELRRPVKSDFHTVVTKTGLSVTFQANEKHLHLCPRQCRRSAPWPCLVHGSPTRGAQYWRLQLWWSWSHGAASCVRIRIGSVLSFHWLSRAGSTQLTTLVPPYAAAPAALAMFTASGQPYHGGKMKRPPA